MHPGPLCNPPLADAQPNKAPRDLAVEKRVIRQGVGCRIPPCGSADVVAAEVVRSPNVKKNRVTACEKMGRFARDGGDWHFFPDGTGRDRGVVEVVPHLDKSK